MSPAVPSEVPEDAVRKTRMWLEKGLYRSRQLDTGTNILAVVPGEKHNTGQHKDRNEVTKWIWTVGEDQGPQRSLKPPTHFQKGRKEQTAYENSFA